MNNKLLLFGLCMLLCVGIVFAYNGNVCSETTRPCDGNCTSTDLRSMYNEYNWSVDSEGYGDITGWNTSCIIGMSALFSNSDFNQDISGWDISAVTDMSDMFYLSVFNQDIGSWDVSSVIDMTNLFANSDFNQDISGWDVSNVVYMDGMFSGATLSIDNYDALLNGWSALTVQPSVAFDAGSSQYSSIGDVGRNILINTYNWSFFDGGIICLVSFVSPPTPLDSSIIFDDNFSVSVYASNFSSVLLSNLSIFLFNTSGLIDEADCISEGGNGSLNISCERGYVDLSAGTYFFNASACDLNGVCAFTETRIVTLNYSFPLVFVVSPLNGSVFSFPNFSVEVNASNSSSVLLRNVSVSLFNASGFLVSDGCDVGVNGSVFIDCFVDFLGLPFGYYFFNASACDLNGVCAFTDTREVFVNFSNTLPIVLSVSLFPLIVFNNDSLQCSAVTFDADFDNVSVFYEWFNNSVLLGESSDVLVLSPFFPFDNLTCRVTPFDGYENGTSLNASILISGRSHVFHNVSSVPFPVLLFDDFFFFANVSDVDGDVFGVNFSVTLPNSSVVVSVGSLVDGLWVSENFSAVEGVFSVFVVGDDGVNSSFGFSVSDDLFISPDVLSGSAHAGESFAFNISVLGSTHNVSFSSVYSLNESFFNVSILPNPLFGDGLIGVFIDSFNSTPEDSFFGNVTVTRDFDNFSVVIPISLTVAPVFGQPFIVDKADWSVSITSSQSVSRNFTINNTGDYNLSECIVSLGGDFVGWGFYSFSLQNFSLGIGVLKVFSVSYSSPPPATYRGYLNVDCVATAGGLHSSLAFGNKPFLQLVSSAPSVLPITGGVGGAGSVLAVKGFGNETLFTVETDAGALNAQLFMYPSQSRKQVLIVSSKVAEDLSLSLSCVGSFCPFVSFSRDSFVLSGMGVEFVTLTLSVPDNVAYGSEFFYDIIVSDDADHSGVLKTSVSVSRLSRWYSKFSPLVHVGDVGFWFSVGGFNVPKLLLFLLITGLAVFVSYLLLPKGKRFRDVASIIYIIVGLIAFVVSSIFL